MSAHDAGTRHRGPDALHAASPLVAADGSLAVVLADRGSGVVRSHHVRNNPTDVVRCVTSYAGIDPVLEPALVAARAGALLLSDALIARRALRRTAGSGWRRCARRRSRRTARPACAAKPGSPG